MSLVWLVPCTSAVVVAAMLGAVLAAVRSEVAALSVERRGLIALRQRAQLVRAESRRTARATALTLDSLAPPARR